MPNKNKSVKILWILFAINIIAALFYNGSFFIPGFSLFVQTSFFYTITALTLVLAFLHARYLLGIKRATAFLILAGMIGFLAEVISLHYGTLFGANYIYKPDGLMIAHVPVMVPVYWAIFIYMGYALSSSFFVWVSRKKPCKKDHNAYILIFLVFLDGVFTTGIDLMMEPIKVIEGSWRWIGGGQYYGAPIGNFIGWFFVTIIVTAVFRIYEYYKPYTHRTNKSLYIMMEAGYVAVILSFIATALRYQLYELVLIGFFVLTPIIAINIMLYIRYMKRKFKFLMNV